LIYNKHIQKKKSVLFTKRRKVMKKLFGVALLASFFLSQVAHAETSSHLRLLLHGYKTMYKSGLGVAAWVIAPDVPKSPSTWLGVIGPRYTGQGWWAEFMGGTIINQGHSTPLLDVRAEFSLLKPFYAWADIEWIDFTQGAKSKFYWYLQMDLVIKGLGLLGVETENVHKRGNDDVSLGPHIVIPMGNIVFTGAYQIHRGGMSQFWIRVALHFKI
jgi:hypothetical protein